MTLLQIWTHSSEGKLRGLAEANELMSVLENAYRAGLNDACDLRINHGHLTHTECLQAAGLPIRL